VTAQPVYISEMELLRNVIDVCWASPTYINVLTDDGAVRIIQVNCPTVPRIITTPVQLLPSARPPVPIFLLEESADLHLKLALTLRSGRPVPAVPRHAFQSFSKLARYSIPETTLDEILDPSLSVALRCARVARFLGDDWEYSLWLAVDSFLQHASDRVLKPVSPRPQKDEDAGALASQNVGVALATGQHDPQLHLMDKWLLLEKDAAPSPTVDTIPSTEATTDVMVECDATAATPLQTPDTSLPAYMDHLRPADVVLAGMRGRTEAQTLAWERLRSRTAGQASQQHVMSNRLMQQLALRFTMAGQPERAIQVLKKSEPRQPHAGTSPLESTYMEDMLWCCLLAVTQGPAVFASTAQSFAVTLIDNGRLDEGVEILCLIGQYGIACRHLSQAGRWREACTLAKATLDEASASEIFRSWATVLHEQMKDSDEAVLVLASVGAFDQVVRILLERNLTDVAVCLVEACHPRVNFELAQTTMQRVTTLVHTLSWPDTTGDARAPAPLVPR
jgi:hypothetical protein